MKALLLSLLFTLPVFSQQDSLVINHRTYYAGETYLDSVKVDMAKLYINHKNIKSARAFYTNTAWTQSGGPTVTFITRKKKDTLVPLQGFIDSIRKSDSIADNEEVQLIVDGELIQNPEGYFIEEHYIKKIAFLISDPKQKGDHLYREPAILITTKAKKKKE
ncbi:MAG: hypothetical protein V4581_12605 [Bacteroidota bacterium]